MAVSSRLSIEEYERNFGPEAGWEYRDGEAKRKPVPTYLHGMLAILLGELLQLAGYFASVEADARLAGTWSPRPDVSGTLSAVEGKYPTRLDVAFEIISDGEDILEKCRAYQATGAVDQVFVFDIENQSIQSWNGSRLLSVPNILLGNGVTITSGRVWRELDSRRKRSAPPSSRLLD